MVLMLLVVDPAEGNALLGLLGEAAFLELPRHGALQRGSQVEFLLASLGDFRVFGDGASVRVNVRVEHGRLLGQELAQSNRVAEGLVLFIVVVGVRGLRGGGVRMIRTKGFAASVRRQTKKHTIRFQR
jgi:hypothetical protein